MEKLNLWECAVIAGLLKAPSRYTPATNPDEATDRAQVVLGAMADEGYITPAQAEALTKNPPSVVHHPIDTEGRYFADWVADQVTSFAGPDHADLVVQTTLDPKLQHAAEARLETMLAGPAVAVRASQGAALLMSPDGAIRAMVGGRDYRDSQFNRVTQALRQPGSSFKPIIYLAAMQAGLTPDSEVDDGPISVGGWSPENFEPGFKGEITLREALANSVNTAAVRVLQRVGIPAVRSLASELGITSPLGRDLSLALGTSEVNLLEMTSVYAGFANGGAAVWPYAISTIRDREGKMIYPPQSARICACRRSCRRGRADQHDDECAGLRHRQGSQARPSRRR